MSLLPNDIFAQVRDMRQSSLEEASILHHYLHWEGLGWPSMKIESSMVVAALPYIGLGFVDIKKIDRSEPPQILKLHPLVKFMLGCLEYELKYVTTLITTTGREYDEDDFDLSSYQLWEIYPIRKKHLGELRKLNGVIQEK